MPGLPHTLPENIKVEIFEARFFAIAPKGFTSKSLLATISEDVTRYLRPTQLGFGTKMVVGRSSTPSAMAPKTR